MKLWCNSFQGFKEILETNNWNDSNLPDNTAFISICDIEKENISSVETHLLSDNHDNVINLDFDDICGYTLPEQFSNDEIFFDNQARGFNDEQAEKLFGFIESHINDDIYVHCAAGVSRSQGVIRFILDCYPERDNETNPNNPCTFPNIHVVSLLKKQYRKKYYNLDE